MDSRERAARVWRYAKWPTIVGGSVFGLALLGFIILYLTIDLPKDPPALSSSVILDANGEELAVLQKDGLRVPVELDEIAPVVTDALISAEDRRFFAHGGIDPLGILRALYRDIRGDHLQGGSTITQQLVKNSYLSQERTLVRKLKESVLALKLERRDDKRSILERYLNTVYFGRGTYGIEAAAQTYFGITSRELALPQAALLIGLLRAPETADPTEHPDRATQRRDNVLDAMVETDRITAAEADAARQSPLGASDRADPVSLAAGVAPHFVEWVRQQAITHFGESAVYGGGLRIHTTLDLNDQRAAEAAVASQLTEAGDPQAALVALDRDGAVKAYVGGRDYAALKVDLARGADGGGSGRQPGSTFKPFVLAAALEKGIPLGRRYPAPATIDLDADGEPWTVDNYGREGYGDLTVLDGTANSVNTLYAQLMLDVGPAAVARLAEAAGAGTDFAAHPSLVLGTEEVSVLDLADGYLTFARQGEQVAPFAITRVEDADGAVLFEAPKLEPTRVIDAETAAGVNFALQSVVQKGTATSARLGRPVAGKTGTTQGFGDAWFAGYTPNYVAVVWMGYPEGPAHAMTDVHGRSVTGGSFPAAIWKAFMSTALEDVPEEDFEAPPDTLLRDDASTTTSSSSTSSSDTSTTSTESSTTTSSSSTSSTTSTTKPKGKDPTTTTTSTGSTTTATSPG